MVIQSIVFPDEICATKEIYYRFKGGCQQQKKGIYLEEGTIFSTNCYMNLFDARAWLRYTGIKIWRLRLLLSGTGSIKVLSQGQDKLEDNPLVLLEKSFTYSKCTELLLTIQGEELQLLYFEIEAKTEVYLYEAQYTY